MIEVDYRHFGFLKAKQIFFGDYLPPCEGYDYIDCKNYFTDLAYRQPYRRIECHTNLIDLTQDSEVIFKQIHKKRRERIRQGLKKGYRIEHHRADADILKVFQRFYERFTAPKGAPKFLTWHALTSLIPNLTVFTGELDEIIYKIMIFIHDGQTVRSHKSTRNEHHPRQKDCASMASLMQWEAMLHFQQLGYQIYDLGGVWANPEDPKYPASQYKMSFGGEMVPTYWYHAKISSLVRTLDLGNTFLKKLRNKFR